jgi:hypothetical protein
MRVFTFRCLILTKKFLCQREFYNSPVTVEDLKIETVEWARRHWALEFSQQFPSCSLTIGEKKVFETVTVAVNSLGVFFLRNSLVGWFFG